MPAILVEIGFLDNTKDNELFDSKRQEIITGITKAILAQLGIKYKEPANPSPTKGRTLYRVMAGSFEIRENAYRQTERLRLAGFDSVIMVLKSKINILRAALKRVALFNWGR